MTAPHHHGHQTPTTRAEWDAALQQGTLTADDAIERLRRVAIHQFGHEGAAGYDDDGFFVSLTAEGIKVEGGVTLRIHTHDHPPPHVHIERPGKTDMRLDLLTGAVIGSLPRDVRASQLRGFRTLIQENYPLLSELWLKNHGSLGPKSQSEGGA